MEEYYAECHKTHKELNGKMDGCQEFMADVGGFNCRVCGCHRNFHRKVAYRECHKIYEFRSPPTVDGCQEFTPKGKGKYESMTCAVCGCHRGFHRKEVTVITSSSQN